MGNEKIDFYFEETGEYAPREGYPVVQRNNIAAIVKFQNQYLLLFWNEVAYDGSLITGGIDEGEDKEEAARREVMEESGYYDIKSITKVEAVNVSRFFVEHKGQNREAFYFPYLVELNSLSQNEIDEYEKKEHSCKWIDREDLDSIVLFENHRKMLNKALEVTDSKDNKQKVKNLSSIKS